MTDKSAEDSVMLGGKTSRRRKPLLRPDMDDRPDTLTSDSQRRHGKIYTQSTETRSGIAAFGNWIVDNISICHDGYALLLKALDAKDVEYGTNKYHSWSFIRLKIWRDKIWADKIYALGH